MQNPLNRWRMVVGGLMTTVACLPSLNGQGGRILQSVDAFYSPSAVVVAEDGRTIYVANAGRGEFGMLAGRGAISRGRLGDDDKVVVDDARFIDGLNAPLGLVILPRSTATLPKGALMSAVGSLWTVDARGNQLRDDRERGTGLVVIDPQAGAVHSRIFLGRGSALEPVLGHPIINPLALTVDPAGNIYLADSFGGGIERLAPGEGRPGVLKLSPAALDALNREEAPPAGSFWFAPVSNMPAAVYYSVQDDMLYWGTANGIGELGGAVFRVAHGDFSGAERLETYIKGEQPILSLTQTPRGTLLAGYSTGQLFYLRNANRAHEMHFYRKDQRFLEPGQMAIMHASDGRLLVAVPELSGGVRGSWRQSVQVFGLPGDF